MPVEIEARDRVARLVLVVDAGAGRAVAQVDERRACEGELAVDEVHGGPQLEPVGDLDPDGRRRQRQQRVALDDVVAGGGGGAGDAQRVVRSPTPLGPKTPTAKVIQSNMPRSPLAAMNGAKKGPLASETRGYGEPPRVLGFVPLSGKAPKRWKE